MKKIRVIIKTGFFSVLFLCAVMSVGLSVQAEAKSSDTIQQGVYVEDIDVSGMTVSEATARVQEYVTSLQGEIITLNATDENQLSITAGDLGLTWKNTEVAQSAAEYGKSGNVIQRYKAKKDLEHENKVFSLVFDIDKNAISQMITDRCSQFNIGAKDATLKRENGAFRVEPGQTGYQIDVAASTDAIYQYLNTEWNHAACAIDLITKVAQPRGTEEELKQVKDVLGTFTTSFRTSGSSRSKNVTNGCHLIDGTTLYPGDTFSTYEEVSPFSEENGYYLAGSYLQGKVVDSLGGGICQVSTTLYNAVIRAELEVIERYNHSMIVSYVDPSSDAAISGTSKDFKFKNTTQYPIYIEGYANSDKNLTFTVYGVETRPATRKVDFESEVIEKIEPKGENIVADAGAPVGTLSVQSAHIGYVAKLWKIVSEDGQEVSRTEFNKSTYQLSPRTATVGIASADPSVTAAMQAAIATGSIDQVKALVGAYKASQTAPPASAPTQADIDSAAESAPLQNPVIPAVQ